MAFHVCCLTKRSWSLTREHRTLLHDSRQVELDLAGRQLLVHGVAATIGERAFDIFSLLVQSQGRLVSKDEIIQRVWSGVAIGDNALEAHVAALRKALGSERGLLKTAYGRGYRVLGTWTARPPEASRVLDSLAPRSLSSIQSNLPVPASTVIGRDDDCSAVTTLLAAHRLVTLVGTGGIGKTRLALEVAHRLTSLYPDGVWMVELGALSDPAMVPAAVAAALGIDISNSDPLETIARSTAGKRLMVVLDTCEHVVEAAAQLAEALLRHCVELRILATSQEPLRAEEESVFSVLPLSAPANNVPAQQMATYSAVQLFLARAAAATQSFPTDDRSMTLVGTVCRRLDGIPLALELAAARAAALGMDVLVSRLDDRLQLLSAGRRTALPRHQTLRATLDWSFGLLSGDEQAVLRRLAVFAGTFDMDAAIGIVAGEDVSADRAVSCIAELVAKSLIVSDADGTDRRYRLLGSTRAYALEKLGEQERARAAKLHAAYLLDVFEQAEAEWGSRPASAWLASFAAHVDDLDAALDWAFAPDGDVVLGARLAACSVPLWFQLARVSAGMARFEKALADIDARSGEARARLHLNAAMGALGMFDPGSIDRRDAAWEATLGLARSLEDTASQLKALRALYASRGSNGDFRAMGPIAQHFHDAAVRSEDPIDFVTAERLVAHMMHVQGRHDEARAILEQLTARPECQMDAPRVVRYQFDHRAIVRMGLGKIEWLQGRPDTALQEIETNVTEAVSLDYVPTLCTLLSEAALPVAFYCGDFAAVERYAAMLRPGEADGRKVAWHGYAECFEGAVAIRRGEVALGMQSMRIGIDLRRAPGKRWHLVLLLSILADALAAAGSAEAGSPVVEEALALAERTGVDWLLPELLRIKGDLLAQHGSTGSAMESLRRAAGLARSHGALTWELRAAMSLARLHHAEGNAALAREVLAPVYQRFTEGHATSDLRQASALLEALQ